MNSSITISDDIQPLKMESQPLDSRLAESLVSSLESLVNEKRAKILPAKKSDIMKKCMQLIFLIYIVARSILSSRKKIAEPEADSIFGKFNINLLLQMKIAHLSF